MYSKGRVSKRERSRVPNALEKLGKTKIKSDHRAWQEWFQ